MDSATPNLPSRDFNTTQSFYSRLGFEEGWKDEGWMILKRGAVALEFFSHPNLNPAESNFSCCLRLDNMAALYTACKDAGVPEQCWGWPRLHPTTEEDSGLTIAYMIDPDGTLLRLLQN
jgi:catechol 2,3-dioxygenase-like lactoylglutathione lyase family enzyme